MPRTAESTSSRTVYAFVHIDKTGGRTVRAVLRRSFGAGHCDIRTPYGRRVGDSLDRSVYVTAADLRRVRWIYRDLRSIGGHNVRPCSDLHEACPEIRYLTFLRDPVGRYLSHFKNRSATYDRADFEQWAAREPLHNYQTRMLAGEPNLARALDILSSRIGFVGISESFDESLLLLGQWVDDPAYDPAYRPVNRLADKSRPRDEVRQSTDLSYLESPAIRARLQEINALDQQLYEQAVKMFERQRAAYRGDLAADVARLRERNQGVQPARDPLRARLLRNYLYKPALLLRIV
jgi:hypothetical protein